MNTKKPFKIATQLASGLLVLSSALAAAPTQANLEVRKPTREDIAAREYKPHPKPAKTKEQWRKRAQAKAARKARSTQHRINKMR